MDTVDYTTNQKMSRNVKLLSRNTSNFDLNDRSLNKIVDSSNFKNSINNLTNNYLDKVLNSDLFKDDQKKSQRSDNDDQNE